MMGKSVSTIYLKAFFDYLESDPSSQARLRPMFDDIMQRAELSGRVPAEEFQQFMKLSAEISGDAFIGLHIGEHIKPGYFGALGYAAMCSDSLGQAMQKHLRYQRLVSDLGLVTLYPQGDEVQIRWQPEVSPVDRQVVENIFSAWVCFGRWICGLPLVPERVCFQHRAPADLSEYKRIFQCPVLFGQEISALVIPRAYTEKPLVQADADLARQFEHQARSLIGKLEQQNDDFIGAVSQKIVRALHDGRADLNQLASTFGLSSRSVQRRLAERGYTFSSLVDKTRRELAADYIKNPTINLTEMTFLLGFSDQPSFQRAFKRWYGETPGQFRRQYNNS